MIDMSRYTQDLQNLQQGLNNSPLVRDLLKIRLTQGEITDVEYTEIPHERGTEDVPTGDTSDSEILETSTTES